MAFLLKTCWTLLRRGRVSRPTGGETPPLQTITEVFTVDFYQVPIGFGMALAQNEAAMLRYAQLEEAEKQNILNKAHNVRSEKEMYTLVASLATGKVY